MTRFSTHRQFAAEPAVVFAAIRDPARLARWWGPAGFTNVFEAFEFAPGGRWKFAMRGPDGAEYPNLSEFVEIAEDRLVRIRHLSPPHFTLSIELARAGAGTRVDWNQDFVDDELAARMRAIVEPANEQNLDRLGAELGAGAGA